MGSKERDKWALYVYSVADGKIIHYTEELSHRILHLAFSGNGRFLVGTLQLKYGMRVWDTSDWMMVANDQEYNGPSYGAAFDDKTGTLYTVSFDGYLRQYGPNYNFKNVKRYPLKSGKFPYHVAVNPKFDRLAVGYGDLTNIEVFELPGITRMDSPSAAGVTNSTSKIAWSADGERLYAGGSFRRGKNQLIRVWHERGEGAPDDIVGPEQTISHLLPCGDDLAFGSYDPALGLISKSGEFLAFRGSAKANMRRKRHGHLTISRDGRRVRFGLGDRSKDPVLFDLDAERLTAATTPFQDLYPPDTGSFEVADWEDLQSPKVGGIPLGKGDELKNRRDEISHSIAIAPDGERFVNGTEWRLRAYNKKDVGAPIWETEIPSNAWAVNVSKDGKLIVAAHGDGTIRWYRMSDGKELLALFVNAEDRRWIAWTPKGYFMSSIGGEDLIGWHLNKGRDKPPQFFLAYRFRDDYYRPDIVRAILATLDEDRAIQKADAVSGRTAPRVQIAAVVPPEIEITQPDTQAEFKKSSVEIFYEIRSPSKIRVTDVFVQIDGINVDPGPIKTSLGEKHRLFIELPKRDSTVSLIPYSGNRRGIESSISLKWAGPSQQIAEKPKLFGLNIGLSSYKKDKLLFGAKDAHDMKRTLEDQRGMKDSPYSDIHKIQILTDEHKPVTKLDILKALRSLKKAIGFSKDPKNSVTIVTYSGHGFVGRNGRFFLMPEEPGNGVNQEDIGVSQEDLFNELADIPGRKILFLDACRSGDAAKSIRRNIAGFMNAIRNGPRLSTFAYASTDSGELSFECNKRGNGCFTAAILESVKDQKSAGAFDPKHVTDTEELRRYLTQRTPKISKQKQKPVMIKSNSEMGDILLFSQ